MSGYWLDLSSTSNRYIQTYMKGFLDMSGGNLLLRNNNILVAAGDISLNGRFFVNGDTSMNGKLYLTNDASLQGRLFVNGDVSFNRNVYARGNVITDVSSSTSIKGSFLVENAVNITGVINQSTATLSGGYIYLPSNVTQEQYDVLVNSLSAVSSVVQVTNNTAQIGIGGITTQAMGPAWISGNLVVGTSSTIGTTNLGTPYGPGSLYVGESITAPNGNVNVGKNAFIGGNLTVTTGNITLTNGSLYVNSGLLFSQGNVVSLGGSIHSAKDISVNGLRLGKGIGGNNISFGSSVLSSVVSEHYINNVAIGSNALSSVTNSGSTTYGANGSNNTALGFNAGAAVTTGGRNTFLGGNTTTSGATFNQSTALGFGATIGGSNQVVLGTAAESVIVAGNVSIGKTTTPGFALDVVGNTQFANDVSINGNLVVNGGLSVKQMQSQTIINMTTTNYQLIVSEDISLNGKLFVSGDVSMGGNLAATSGTSENTYKNLYGKAPPTNVYGNLVVSPNTTNATSGSWINNNIAWSVSQSSIRGANEQGYHAFDTASSTRWLVANYTAANFGAYTGTATTPNIQVVGTINGEWFNLNASAPLVMKTYSMSTWSGNVNYLSEFPGRYFIVGSNDGVTWNRIIDVSFTSNPVTTTNVNGGTITIPTTTTTGGNISTIIANAAAGSVTGSFNTYNTTTQAYIYFRLIVTNKNTGGSLLEQFVSLSEWAPTFSVPTVTGPSRTLLYMDPSNINQLDVSGSLGLINTNASTMTVTPNTAGAALGGWQNNNITWSATATNPQAATSETGFSAFNNQYLTSGTGANSPYLTQPNLYNATSGSYNAATPTITTVDTVTISGEYIQLNSSVPLVMKTYNLTSRFWTANAPYHFACDFPRQYKIVGSNDGLTWTSIQDAQFSAAPITTAATITTYSQTTATYNIVTTTSAITQQSNNSITGYANASNAYSYFRIIVRAIMGTTFGFSNPTADTRANFFWNVNFSPPTSSVSMALDVGFPNQLNVGGSMNVAGALGLAGGITPMYSTPTFGPGQVGYTYETNTPSNISVINATETNLLSLTVMPGVYIVEAHARCNPTSNNTVCYLYLKLNGAQVYNGYSLQQFASTTYNNSLAITTVVPVLTPNSVILTQGYTNAATHTYGYNILRATRIA